MKVHKYIAGTDTYQPACNPIRGAILHGSMDRMAMSVYWEYVDCKNCLKTKKPKRSPLNDEKENKI